MSPASFGWPLERAIALCLALLPAPATADAPHIHTVTGKNGLTFRHFELQLSADNTLLPGDPAIKRKRLDETTDNFRYGQFEVFVPADRLSLDMGCKSNYIVRMPMTLDSSQKAAIEEKQALYFATEKAVESKSGSVHAVIEPSGERGCNLFFRSGPGGRYVGRVGPIQ